MKISRYDRYQTLRPYVSSRNKVLIFFRSDRSVQYAGIHAQYTAIAVTDSGFNTKNFAEPSFPSNYFVFLKAHCFLKKCKVVSNAIGTLQGSLVTYFTQPFWAAGVKIGFRDPNYF